MALIRCPECGNQVSTVAASCPQCGAPVASWNIQTPLATIQRTSKPLKLQGCLSMLLLCFGIAVFVTASSSAPAVGSMGIFLAIIGAIWVVITRIRIWWHHE